MGDDVERFEALYRRHFRAVLGYALARLGPEQAKDAAADTFLVARLLLPPKPANLAELAPAPVPPGFSLTASPAH